MSHSHSHSHTHSPVASTSSHAHSHDFASANKSHFNSSHSHSHSHSHAHNSTSALQEWTASKCVESILDAYDFNEEETELLDYACGKGIISQKLIGECKSIVGIDISSNLVEAFNTSVSNNGLEPSDMMAIQLDELKDEATSLGGRLFDVVICAQSYHHIQDVQALTLALTRRLKLGGMLIVIDLDNQSSFSETLIEKSTKEGDQSTKIVAHRGGFSQEELREIFEKTGRLEDVEVEVSHSTTMREMAILKGKAETLSTKADLEIRWLIATGVRNSNV